MNPGDRFYLLESDTPLTNTPSKADIVITLCNRVNPKKTYIVLRKKNKSKESELCAIINSPQLKKVLNEQRTYK